MCFRFQKAPLVVFGPKSRNWNTWKRFWPIDMILTWYTIIQLYMEPKKSDVTFQCILIPCTSIVQQLLIGVVSFCLLRSKLPGYCFGLFCPLSGPILLWLMHPQPSSPYSAVPVTASSFQWILLLTQGNMDQPFPHLPRFLFSHKQRAAGCVRIGTWPHEKRDLGARWFGRKEGLISQSRAPVFCRLSKKPNNRRDQATRLSGIAAPRSWTPEMHEADSKTEFANSFACSRCSGHWCQSDEHISSRNGPISCTEAGTPSGQRLFEAARWSVMGAMSRHHSCEAGGKLFAAGAMISLIAPFQPGGIPDYDGQFLFIMIVCRVYICIFDHHDFNHHRGCLLGGILTGAEISGKAD